MKIKLNEYLNRKFFFNILDENIEDNSRILELGAGKSSYLRTIGKKNIYITAIDIFQPSLDIAKERGVYDEYICYNVLQSDELFEDKSFDYVICFDLIEHLEKEQGYKLVNLMTKLAKKAIVLYTPNGFLPQEPIEGNKYQRHISGWSFKEMIKLGFDVYGVNGLKILRKEFGKSRIKPAKIGIFISDITWLLIKILKIERFSFSILCIKHLGE